jgi:hypothetical protein
MGIICDARPNRPIFLKRRPRVFKKIECPICHKKFTPDNPRRKVCKICAPGMSKKEKKDHRKIIIERSNLKAKEKMDRMRRGDYSDVQDYEIKYPYLLPAVNTL